MKLFLIRHGETFENAGSKLMGRTHGILSDLGKDQAEKTGARLKSENITVIYSSPLNRCLDTAEIINKSLNLKISEHDLLIERDFGKFTNAKAEEIDFDLLDQDTEDNKVAGVEPMSSLQKRVADFLQELQKSHKDENIAIITHNNPIRFFLAYFLNKSYIEILKEFRVKNCSLNVFETADGINYKEIIVDDITHLK